MLNKHVCSCPVPCACCHVIISQLINHLGDELVMVGEVCSAVDAAVGAVAAGQVRLEGFGARHGDHGPGRWAVQEGAAGPGRLTWEAPQHTGEGRGGAGWEVYTCTHRDVLG